MTQEIKQRIAGKAVIIHSGKVLILRESKKYDDGTHAGRYDLPGGRVEPGEHIEETLVREAKEECGLDVEVGRPIFVGDWSPVVKDVQLQIFGIFFKCTIKKADVILSQDHDDFKWIDPRETDQYDLMSPITEVLKLL